MNTQEAFQKLITTASQSHELYDKDIAVLQEISDAFPWFITARVLYNTVVDGYDPLAELHYSAYRRPLQPLEKVSPQEFGICENNMKLPEENVIDKFLQKGEYRIMPGDLTSDEDKAAQYSDIDLTDDFVSEELAEIYRAQGLNRQAKLIYEKLSLLNPEKSIYFAEIIEGFDKTTPRVKGL